MKIEAILSIQTKQLTSKEVHVYIKLLKYALECLDVFMAGRSKNGYNLSISPNYSKFNQKTYFRSQQCNKEEKDTIESLGLIFSLLHPLTLKEIFTLTIDYLIERTFKNLNISIISSYFLATPATSYTFATILIEYLLSKMELMGCKCNNLRRN